MGKVGCHFQTCIFGLLPRDPILTIVSGKTSGSEKASPFFGTKSSGKVHQKWKNESLQ
jgi:hypothetical protein